MWPDERVMRLVSEDFVPARVHVRDQPEDYQRFAERYGADWTPTILVLDPGGTERHRIEGFLPAGELLAQISLGLGHVQFARKRFEQAERRFRGVLARHPDTDAAPAALYWAGVAKFKATGDGAALAETARAFQERYRESSWARKASVWSG